jgi:hypothetical protein
MKLILEYSSWFEQPSQRTTTGTAITRGPTGRRDAMGKGIEEGW